MAKANSYFYFIKNHTYKMVKYEQGSGLGYQVES
jgi:hypothetical protein